MPNKKKKPVKKMQGIQNKDRMLELAEDGQYYAKISKLLGNCRVYIILPDERQVLGVIPGSFRHRKKRIFFNCGDIVLASKREDYKDEKYDLLFKFTPEEVLRLYAMKEVPKFFLDKEATNEETNNDGIDMSVLSDEENYSIDDI